MSDTPVVPVTPATTTYFDAAMALIEQIRAMRQQIPNLVIPASKLDTKRLIPAASVSAQFVELANVATTGEASVGAGLDAEQVRDQLSYAAALSPVADELEALAQFVRHSVVTAKHKAGSAALTTYALAKVLAKRPDTAVLAPNVADMKRALGRSGGKSKAKAKPAPTPATPVPTQSSPSTQSSPVTPTKP